MILCRAREEETAEQEKKRGGFWFWYERVWGGVLRELTRFLMLPESSSHTPVERRCV